MIPIDFNHDIRNTNVLVIGSPETMGRANRFAESLGEMPTMVIGEETSELPLGYDVIYILAPNGVLSTNQTNLYEQVSNYLPAAEAKGMYLGEGSDQQRSEVLRKKMVCLLFSKV